MIKPKNQLNTTNDIFTFYCPLSFFFTKGKTKEKRSLYCNNLLQELRIDSTRSTKGIVILDLIANKSK